ncbi:MAG: hypothetical protein NTW33_07905 [Methanoregula sp.]|nr:hypothetical protein [Methanoregula sp.]
MAKPIEIGLVLKGDDAKAFQNYLEHPTFTREGLNLMREAKRDAEDRQKSLNPVNRCFHFSPLYLLLSHALPFLSPSNP